MAVPSPEDLVDDLRKVGQLNRELGVEGLMRCTKLLAVEAVVEAAGGPRSTDGQRAMAAEALIRYHVDHLIADSGRQRVVSFGLNIAPEAVGKNVATRKGQLAREGFGRDAYDLRLEVGLFDLASWLLRLDAPTAAAFARAQRETALEKMRSTVRRQLEQVEADRASLRRPSPRQPTFDDYRPHYQLIASDLTGLVDHATRWIEVMRGSTADGSDAELVATLWSGAGLFIDISHMRGRLGLWWHFGERGREFERLQRRIGVRVMSSLYNFTTEQRLSDGGILDGDDLATFLRFAAFIMELPREASSHAQVMDDWQTFAASCTCDLDDPDPGNSLPSSWHYNDGRCRLHDALAAVRLSLTIMAEFGVEPLIAVNVATEYRLRFS